MPQQPGDWANIFTQSQQLAALERIEPGHQHGCFVILQRAEKFAGEMSIKGREELLGRRATGQLDERSRRDMPRELLHDSLAFRRRERYQHISEINGR
jgi:hypothetical protein